MLRLSLPAALAAACLAWPAAGQSLRSDEILSSIAVAPISQPHPVLGADGRVHLAYELMVSNPSHLFVTLDKVEALDPAGAVLGALEGDALTAMTQMWDGTGRMLDPGGTAIVFMDVSLAGDAALPEAVTARVTATRQVRGDDGKPAPLPDGTPVPATYSFTGAPAVPGAAAVVIDPPLRGDGWVAANGCCDSITSHRGATMAVNGALKVPERTAIDWVKLDGDGRIFSGEGTRVEDYVYYGAPVHSVADGTVVNLYDGADEQVPGPDAVPTGITTEGIGGNMIVVDIGGGNFAFYAHLQKGSLTVALGDTVTAGQELGLVGNTGNTTAPHLHFHVMDTSSPLDAQGLPYVFRRFTRLGVLAADADIENGTPAAIDARLAGEKADAMPLNNEVVGFD